MAGHCVNNAQARWKNIKSYEINTIPEDLVIQKVLLFYVFLEGLMLGMKTISVLVLVTQWT